jgi:hypothetical protein
MTSMSRLRDVLTRASTREAPEVNPDFADQLEQRLRMLAGGPVPKGGAGERAVRRPPWHAATALAVAAAAVAAVIVARHTDTTSQVRTLDPIETTTVPETSTTVTTASSTTTSTSAPATTTTTSEAPVAITTTTPPPAPTTTTTTARPAATTTTTAPAPTTTTTVPSSATTSSSTTSTTVRPTTTTTTQPGQGQNLALTCNSNNGTVICRWAQSTSADFDNYIVLRENPATGEKKSLLETKDRTAVEAVDTAPLRGVQVKYGVLARTRTMGTVGQGGPIAYTFN